MLRVRVGRKTHPIPAPLKLAVNRLGMPCGHRCLSLPNGASVPSRVPRITTAIAEDTLKGNEEQDGHRFLLDQGAEKIHLKGRVGSDQGVHDRQAGDE